MYHQRIANLYFNFKPVGSGSAGSVIAARLSEDRDVTVLVLEAGIDDRNEAVLYTPSEGPNSQLTKFDWAYFTEPQKQACWALKENVNKHTHSYTHAYIHTCIHTHTHTYKHTLLHLKEKLCIYGKVN